jgi:TPR repeat protein
MMMNRIFAGLALFLYASSAMSDIWSSLYKEKLQEAINGNSDAQFDVGTMYQNGRGVQADRNEAIEWYKKSAAQGDAKATSRLQLMQANSTRFDKTARQAAKGDLESQYDLGNMYMTGVGTNIDYAKAINAFKQSAGGGHVKSTYKLGLIYHEGTGVRRNDKTAFKWFKQAADNGYPAAQYYLGKLYADGSGVTRNKTEALVWLGKAVDGGFDQARGEMINVTESMRTTAKQDTSPATRQVKPAAKKVRAAKKTASAPRKKSGARHYSIEDLVLAAWNRDGKPVSYLPSAINNCRTEDGRVICFSDDQTRSSGANVIKFKTKAIIDNFSSNGSFDVTYRNLVVNSTQSADTGGDEGSDEVGSLGDSQPRTYKVKAGWSNPHTLKCRIKNSGTLTCLKNNTHSILLTSPTTLAAGD